QPTTFEELDINDGWQQAHLEVADQCFEYPCLVARAPENRYRNRHRYVSPYDHSRVHAHNDYINASLVVMQVAQRKYILTQGPLPNTCGHFWLMVWQQNSRGVVMLNKLVERSSIKCSQYWPPHLGQSLLFEEMSISVHLEGEDVRAYYKIHHLRLENMVTGEKKPISHFQFTQWPDLGVPESPIPFLAFLSVVRDSGCLSHEQGPVVIHCTSGIGRSGVFALVDACLVMMESKEHPFSLNIRQVLVNMRKYRMGLIQTPEQLRFSYMAVIRGAKQLKKNEQQKK
uniref:protein-tyrosine-phosphatase n=1 Tax=Monodelphis domestica TaxID=13616 RepID=F7FEV7_MONDO